MTTKKTESEKVKELAGLFWEALNKVDFDPMHPNYNHFDDDIKDVFEGMAKTALSL